MQDFISNYVNFNDDDDLLGVWFCGDIDDHFWCVCRKKDGIAYLDFKLQSTHTIPGKEADLQKVVDRLNEQSIPVSELGATDKEAHLEVHDILYTIVPQFIPTSKEKGGGVLVLGPCKGKRAKEVFNDPKQVNWERLLGGGQAKKGSC